MDNQPKRKRRLSPSKVHKIALRNQKTEQIGTENFININGELNADEIKLIEKEITIHTIMNKLSEEEIHQLSFKFFKCQGKEGEYLFQQDDPYAEHFFIVLKGELTVEINGVIVETYEDSGSFGDMALMYNAPRSASVKFITDVEMLALSSNAFKSVLRRIKLKQYEENHLYLSNASFFKDLSKQDLERLAASCMTQNYKPGKTDSCFGSDFYMYFL